MYCPDHLFPGAILEELDIEQATETDVPLVMKYSFRVPSLGRWSEGGASFQVAPLVPGMLGQRYAREADRRYDRVFPNSVHTRLSMDLRLPAGMEVVALPPTQTLEESGGTFFSTAAERSAQGMRWTRETRIPARRIKAPDYKAFADFCRAVDQVEASEIALRRRP